MGYEWKVAKRYIWSKRRHPFVGVISTISVLGIAVGVAALIVVLAVMNGFDEDLKSRIIGMRAHLVIEKDGAFGEYGAVLSKLVSDARVSGASAYIEGQALIQKDDFASGVIVRGVDPARERSVSKFYDYAKEGTLTDRPGYAAVGSELARRAGLSLGSDFSVLSQNAKKPIVYRVEGIFSSGMYEYDANLVFVGLKNAQQLFEMGGSVSGVSVSLKNSEDAARVKSELSRRLRYPYYVRTWMEMNKTLFGALKLEKIVMALILVLIILVACLNIAGSLTILVMDKTRDIGVLKALGARPFGLMKIFALDGLFVGSVGAVSGLALGGVLCVLLKNFSFVDLPKEIYYVDRLPVRVDAWDTALVVAAAVGLSFISAFYPAVTAGKLDPVKALRYE